MDPTACYALLKAAISDLDTEAVDEHMGNLQDWLRKGGFLPEGVTREQVEATFDEARGVLEETLFR
jgi:hypothetical protein